MDTKWKKFRYGTEKRNPSWSFFGSLVCPVWTLMACSMTVRRGSGIALVAGLWFLVFTVISLVHLGRIMGNGKKNLFSVKFLDRTCPDLILFLFLVILLCNSDAGWWSYSSMVKHMFDYLWHPVIFLEWFLLISFMTGSMVFFALLLYISVMRHLSREELCRKLFFIRQKDYVKGKLQKRKEYREAWTDQKDAVKIFRRRQLWLLCGQNLLFLLVSLWMWGVRMGSAMTVLFPMGMLFFLLDLVFLLKVTKEVGILLDEIRHVSEDRIVWEEPRLKRSSVFRKSEEEILNIRKIKRESMDKQLQSERMKVDLITNVSHDLKTPLTSMIGCIDLLKQVKELPQEAQDYVNLLSDKAERLRGMIQDVFDMAKATSGGQDLQMEQLDMVRLIRQTAADMQDRIEKSGLHYRMKFQDGELLFLGDSRKMYRVYQNLMENTLKYSMPGSRVYVEVSKQGGRIRTSFKNTSESEMDFSAEEIMERFTRGDKSRSTEGNGLGLAIARSFTEACGGSLQVLLDGDLFRVDTEFPVVSDRTAE